MAQKDKYPQWLNLNFVTESAINTYTQVVTNVPVRLEAQEVMEILGVEWRAQPGGLVSDADEDASFNAHISTRTTTGRLSFDSPDVIDCYKMDEHFEFAEAVETGGGGSSQDLVAWHDFGSSGKGFLSAAQSFFLGLESVGAAAVGTVSARLLYRIVKVSAAELIGLVSQLAGQ